MDTPFPPIHTSTPSSLHLALAPKPPEPPRSEDNSEQKQDGAQQQQLENSFQRTVALVFWHKPKSEPVRVHLEVPSWPLFKLAKFPALVAELSLSNSSYIDVYNESTSQWEQRSIDTVSKIPSSKRFLFRARKSLLEGMTDEDCVGLDKELRIQTKTSKPLTPPLSTSPDDGTSLSGRKRAAVEDSGLQAPPSKIYVRSPPGYPGYPQHHAPQAQGIAYAFPAGQAYPHGMSIPPDVSMEGNGNGVGGPVSAVPSLFIDDSQTPGMSKRQSPMYHFHAFQNPPVPFSAPLSPHVAAPHSQAAPMPYHPHPPMRRWPNDYTVMEIAKGFRSMDTLVNQRPSVTQRVAFERVFNVRYVKSTVCRHRGLWRRADPKLKDAYERLGEDERAVWGEFVRKVEGRPSGKAGEALLIDEEGEIVAVGDKALAAEAEGVTDPPEGGEGWKDTEGKGGDEEVGRRLTVVQLIAPIAQHVPQPAIPVNTGGPVPMAVPVPGPGPGSAIVPTGSPVSLPVFEHPLPHDGSPS